MTREGAGHDVREGASVALARLRIEPQRLEAYFLAELGRTHRDPRWRETAVAGFAYVCTDPGTIVATLTGLIDGDRPSRAALFGLCEHAAHPDFPIERMFELRRSLGYWRGESNRLFEVAHKAGPRAVPFLVESIHEDLDYQVRGQLFGALRDFGADASAATEPLLEYVENPQNRDDSKPDAIRALNRIAPDSRDVDDRLLAYIVARAADPAIRDPAAYSARRTVNEALLRPMLRERVATGDFEQVRALWPEKFE
jgi:hypothetical protein